jgi:Homeodomain-like domain
MQQRGQTTTFQTRLEISEQSAAGLNDTQIAPVVGCSVWTVRKWRRRWRKRGRLGFTSQMGRSATGPMSTFALLIPFPLASFLLSWCLLLPVYVRLALLSFQMRLFSLR